MKQLLRLLREPLFHFVAIGGLIFAFYAVVDDTREARADVIIISTERLDQLAAGYKSVWQRMPTDTELDALIEAEIREEVYYREALALGLDRNDAIVRRRMAQKMEFLLDTGAYFQEPAEAELDAYFAANEQAYRSDLRLAFEQIYFGETPAPDAISQSLSVLRADPPADPATLGERTLLPVRLSLSPLTAVEGVFGTGFFDLLAALPSGEWAGPVASSYGVHLVRIMDTLPARTPPLAEIRDAVLWDWRAAKAREINEQDYAERREHFIIEIRRRDARPAESQ